MKKLGKFIWPRSHNGIYLLSKNSVSLYIIPEEIPHVQGQRRSPSKTVQFSWVTLSRLTLCDPMNHSMPGLSVHHQLPELPKPMSIESVCHPAVSSSVVPFSSCRQSFPASGSFQMSQLSPSGGQSVAVSASTSVPPMNTQDWCPLGWTGWISLQSKGISRVFSNTTV